MSHVVNNSMMLKSGALLWRLTGLDEHLNSAEKILQQLDGYHGMVTGIFTGDECLAGNSPVQGTELCAVSEFMYSLEQLLAITGGSHWGDRLEQITFNALPATFSPDMWTHQYIQQVNQVECSVQNNPNYLTNSGEANLFGLEPNFGCCTANLSQAWPKFALSTIMRSSDGLAAVAYAPCAVTTTINGIGVNITLETDYPFRGLLYFKIRTQKELNFTFWLRIPEWAKDAMLEMDGCKTYMKNGNFYPIKRNWKDVELALRFPMKPFAVPRPNNLYAVTRGPLVYSLPLGERWVKINENLPNREFPHCDYEIYPTTNWNYMLCIDKNNPALDLQFEEHTIGDCPFSPEGAPVTAYVSGRQVDWSLKNGAAECFPKKEWVSDKIEKLKLIPYGCTNLRMTEMPFQHFVDDTPDKVKNE